MIATHVLKRIVLLSFLLGLVLVPKAALGDGGTGLFWDIPLIGPSGPWDLGHAFWSPNAVGGSLTTWVNGSNAVFSAGDIGATGDYTVTLAANVTVGDLTYTGGGFVSTLRIAAGLGTNTITMANATMNVTVDPFTTLIVAPKIAGVGGALVLQGIQGFQGTLVLTGANTYTGGTTIAAGTLQLGDIGATGSILGAVVNSDTFNIFNANTTGITTITNTNSLAFTNFFNTSTAGTTTITNNFGTTNFFNTSTAAKAAIINSGGFTTFNNTSTAGAAVITNNGGETEFFDTSTAGNATITMNGSGFAEFFDNSTAGNATLIINSGGETEFNISSTAGNATIINNNNGFINFKNASTAGNAAITNNGGVTEFFDTSTAGNSTITTNSGGLTLFFNTSTGGNARFITNAGGILDISKLTSLGMTAGSIEGEGTYQLGSKTLTVGLNNLSTVVSGTIIDGGFNGGVGGSLIKVGTGTLTLTGPNTYTGGTSFNEGIVAVNSDANLGTGGLSFNGGTLQALAAGGGIISSKAIALNALGGTFLADPGTASTFSGNVIGPGAFTKTGAGTLTLTGPNTYTGGTSFNGGIVAVNSDANLGTGGLSFNGGTLQALAAGGGIISSKAIVLNAPGGTFLADPGTASTLSGVISGAGSLTKGGLGTLALTGANTYTGGTVLNAGTLTVNGAHALGIGNVVVTGGTLNADPQPINVTGNYTQAAGGTLQLQVAGAQAGQYDSLKVGGNASLGGTLQLISVGFQPRAGDQLTLVTAGGVVSGRFAQFEDPFPAAPGFTLVGLVYGMNSVLLEFRSFASFALTANELAAAKLIDAVHLDPRAANLVSFLSQEPFRNLAGDFGAISPDGLTAFYEIGFSNANIQRLNLEGRLDDIRNGSNGFTSNMKVNGAMVNLEDKAGADGKSSKGVVGPVLQPGPENRWGVWATGFGDFVNVDGDGNAQGYNFTTGGVSLGIDYRITDQLAIGVMGDYSHTWTSLNPSGHIDVDSGRGGLYATWYNHGIYLDGAVYGGHNNYDSSRSVLGGLASGGTEGAAWSTFISGGYDFHFGPLTAGPIAALQYTYVNIDGFSENGSLAPLAIHSGSVESLRSDVGFRAFYQWHIGKIALEPSLKAAWEHEYKYSALPITAGFAGIPGPSATFLGPSEGHDSAVVSAGISVRLTPAITAYVNYDGQLGRENYDSNAVTGGVRITF